MRYCNNFGSLGKTGTGMARDNITEFTGNKLNNKIKIMSLSRTSFKCLNMRVACQQQLRCFKNLYSQSLCIELHVQHSHLNSLLDRNLQ